LMAIPNLIGLLMLSPVIVRETRQYFDAAEETRYDSDKTLQEIADTEK
jgi:Na+/alanine symporter